jgi:hypothetical protein
VVPRRTAATVSSSSSSATDSTLARTLHRRRKLDGPRRLPVEPGGVSGALGGPSHGPRGLSSGASPGPPAGLQHWDPATRLLPSSIGILRHILSLHL